MRKRPSVAARNRDHPGHNPHWRITYKADGGTRTKSLHEAAAIKKAERDDRRVRRFQQFEPEFVVSTSDSG
jgi:hypothetical protein